MSRCNAVHANHVCNLMPGHDTEHMESNGGLSYVWPLSPTDSDPVNHPPHYGGDTTYETIKVIEAWALGFCLGNAVKYISRAGHKGDALEDLRKARWYLDREIAKLEK